MRAVMGEERGELTKTKRPGAGEEDINEPRLDTASSAMHRAGRRADRAARRGDARQRQCPVLCKTYPARQGLSKQVNCAGRPKTTSGAGTE